MANPDLPDFEIRIDAGYKKLSTLNPKELQAALEEKEEDARQAEISAANTPLPDFHGQSLNVGELTAAHDMDERAKYLLEQVETIRKWVKHVESQTEDGLPDLEVITKEGVRKLSTLNVSELIVAGDECERAQKRIKGELEEISDSDEAFVAFHSYPGCGSRFQKCSEMEEEIQAFEEKGKVIREWIRKRNRGE